MGLHRVRITVRRMMALVAIMALLAYACLLAVRSAGFLKLARRYEAEATMYAELERIHLGKVDEQKKGVTELSRRAEDAEGKAAARGTTLKVAQAESNYASNLRAILALKEGRLRFERDDATRYSIMRRHYERLIAKYQCAAMQPWLSVALDPPPPDP
jgi:hypothetical protein